MRGKTASVDFIEALDITQVGGVTSPPPQGEFSCVRHLLCCRPRSSSLLSAPARATETLRDRLPTVTPLLRLPRTVPLRTPADRRAPRTALRARPVPPARQAAPALRAMAGSSSGSHPAPAPLRGSPPGKTTVQARVGCSM